MDDLSIVHFLLVKRKYTMMIFEFYAVVELGQAEELIVPSVGHITEEGGPARTVDLLPYTFKSMQLQ